MVIIATIKNEKKKREVMNNKSKLGGSKERKGYILIMI